MHKKLEAELISLAHSILQMKNRDDVVALQKKSQEVFEKLSVLKFVNEYVSETPSLTETKEEIVAKIENSLVKEKEEVKEEVKTQEIVNETKVEEPVEVKKEEVETILDVKLEEPVEKNIEKEPEVSPLTKEQIKEIFHLDDELKKDDVNEIPSIQMTLEEELKNAISSDVATTMFEKATKNNPIVEEVAEELIEEKKRSLRCYF